MNHLKQYPLRELRELQEMAVWITQQNNTAMVKDLSKIALVVINAELDLRKIQKEGRDKT